MIDVINSIKNKFDITTDNFTEFHWKKLPNRKKTKQGWLHVQTPVLPGNL